MRTATDMALFLYIAELLNKRTPVATHPPDIASPNPETASSRFEDEVYIEMPAASARELIPMYTATFLFCFLLLIKICPHCLLK